MSASTIARSGGRIENQRGRERAARLRCTESPARTWSGRASRESIAMSLNSRVSPGPTTGPEASSAAARRRGSRPGWTVRRRRSTVTAEGDRREDDLRRPSTTSWARGSACRDGRGTGALPCRASRRCGGLCRSTWGLRARFRSGVGALSRALPAPRIVHHHVGWPLRGAITLLTGAPGGLAVRPREAWARAGREWPDVRSILRDTPETGARDRKGDRRLNRRCSWTAWP